MWFTEFTKEIQFHNPVTFFKLQYNKHFCPPTNRKCFTLLPLEPPLAMADEQWHHPICTCFLATGLFSVLNFFNLKFSPFFFLLFHRLVEVLSSTIGSFVPCHSEHDDVLCSSLGMTLLCDIRD